MTTIIDDALFDLLPPPQFGSYSIKRAAKKIVFQAADGYKHQREAYPTARYQFTHGWNCLTAAQYNMLVAWLDFAKSNAFYYVVPDTEAFAGMVLETHLVRIIEDEIEISIIDHGYYRAKIVMEDL